MAKRTSPSTMEAVDEYFDMLIKSRFNEMFQYYVANEPYTNVLVDNTKKGFKFDSKYYEAKGEVAIVDQGQSLVCGYKSKEMKKNPWIEPSIIYGDHTEIFKFINFPFYLGADGTKLLSVKCGWEPLFIYYYLKYNYHPIGGYRRHFVFVKKMMFSKPPIDQQKRFVTFVEQVDKSKAICKQIFKSYDDLVKSRFNELLAKEKYKMVPVEDLVKPERPITYGILKPGDYCECGIFLIKGKDYTSGYIDKNNLYKVSCEISNTYKRSLLEKGDIIFAIRGSVGHCIVVPEELTGANITQDTARVSLKNEYNVEYICSVFRSILFQQQVIQHTKGAAIKGINLGDFRKMKVPIVDRSHQDQFASFIQQVDKSKFRLIESLERLVNSTFSEDS